jgi:hypothetical protein
MLCRCVLPQKWRAQTLGAHRSFGIKAERHSGLPYIRNSGMETDFRTSFGLGFDPIFDSRTWIGRHWVSQ